MVSLKMRCFSRMFDEVVAWGSLFLFRVLGLSVAPISQCAIPLAVFCRPFGAYEFTSASEAVNGTRLAALQHLTNSPL